MFFIKLSDCTGTSAGRLQFQTLSSFFFFFSLWTGFLTHCFKLHLCTYTHFVSALFDASLPVLKLIFKVWSQIGPYLIIHLSPPARVCLSACVLYMCVGVSVWVLMHVPVHNLQHGCDSHACCWVFMCRGTVLWKFVLAIQQLFCKFPLYSIWRSRSNWTYSDFIAISFSGEIYQ